jgi:hypothetical protein
MFDRQLIGSFLELSIILVHLSLQLIKSLLISILFVSVVLLPPLHFDIMSLYHLCLSVIIIPLHLQLLIHKLFISLRILYFFVVDFVREFCYFLILLLHLQLHLSLFALLRYLDLLLIILDF